MTLPKDIGLSLLALLLSTGTFPAAHSEAAPVPAKPAAEPGAAPGGGPLAGVLPGLVARGYLGGDHPALQSPTPIVFVIKSGAEFPEDIRPRIENALRGTMDVGRLEYAATGLIVLESDAEVRFEINNMVCKVDGKDFGNGNYTRAVERGTHSIELTRRGWASGKPSFAIIDSVSGQPVLFHTAAALQSEIDRSVKIDEKPVKSKLLEPAQGGAAPDAAAGEIVVTSALFGSGTKVADVTKRVTALLVSEPQGFGARADWLHADPIPYKSKALVIAYDYNGGHFLFVVPQGERISHKLLLENAEHEPHEPQER